MLDLNPASVQMPRGRCIGGRVVEAMHASMTCIAHIAGAHGTACRAGLVKRQLRFGAGCISRFAHGGCVLQ